MIAISALHGAVGSPDDWTALESSLGWPMRKVNLWDSPPGLDLGAWGAHFCRTEKPGGLLLGYSLGARLALHALLQAPDRWRAAVLLCPHPGLTSEAERRERTAADGHWAHLARSLPWEEFLQTWNAQPVLGAMPVAQTQRGLESHRSEIAASFDRWSLGRQRDLRAELSKIQVPVLWLTGSRDEKFTRLAAGCCEWLAQCRHRVIPNAGHRLHLEASDEVAAEMKRFAQDLLRH